MCKNFKFQFYKLEKYSSKRILQQFYFKLLNVNPT